MSPFVAVVAGTLAMATYDGRYDRDIDAAIEDAAHVYPVPRALVVAVIWAESAFDPRAISRTGAVGLMQVMPATAKKVGVNPADLLDPGRNVLAGVRLLAVLLRHYQGDVIDALVAYNAGPQRTLSRPPANGETPTYVARVLASCILRRCPASEGWLPPGPRER
jgi:soluble lytic murein transglycosylase-like protein